MSLLSFPGKVMEEILLESTAKPRKAKKVMGSVGVDLLRGNGA